MSGNDLKFFKTKAEQLGIVLYGNCADKLHCIQNEILRYDYQLDKHVAYIGDDDNDIEILKHVAISGCPSDASKNVKKICNYISPTKGGEGAIRDFLEYIFDC